MNGLILKSLTFLAVTNLVFAEAHARKAARPVARVGVDTDARTDGPQEFVVCTGWHALCSASPDCRVNGNKAACDCLRVNETHIVETSAIRDADVARLTRAQCTNERPCDVDRAPVCKAIRRGQYIVDNVKYEWVSTYSYRGWCSLLKSKPRACDQRASGYSGDLFWALCDAAPCAENPNPSDAEKPLTCQCLVESVPFVGPNGTCTGDSGGIISSFPLSAWDFETNTYAISMPGYEYVQGACAPLKSDPLKEPSRRNESR